MQDNHNHSPTATPVRPKLSLRGLAPGDDHYWFVWVVGRRAPQFRHGSKSAALKERDRLRATGLDARAFEAHVIQADR